MTITISIRSWYDGPEALPGHVFVRVEGEVELVARRHERTEDLVSAQPGEDGSPRVTAVTYLHVVVLAHRVVLDVKLDEIHSYMLQVYYMTNFRWNMKGLRKFEGQ